MKAAAFEHYPTYFSKPGAESGAASERDRQHLSLRPSCRGPEGAGPLRLGAHVSPETQKGLGSGLVCRPMGLSNLGLLSQVMLDNKENLLFSAHIA